MENTYLDYISKVSLVNNESFKNKVKQIQSHPNWKEDIFPQKDIYKANYYDKFNEIANDVFNISNNMINMPNKFLLSLILGMSYEVLELVNEDFTNLFPILENEYEWGEIEINELKDLQNPYWNKCKCSCGQEIVIKCFIYNKKTKIMIRAGKDCFEKSGFINPKMNDIIKARKEALETIKCMSNKCNKNFTNNTLKLCDYHFKQFLTCKKYNCNQRSHSQDFSAHYYHCYNHRDVRMPYTHECRYCSKTIKSIYKIYCNECKDYLDTYYFKNNVCEINN